MNTIKRNYLEWINDCELICHEGIPLCIIGIHPQDNCIIFFNSVNYKHFSKIFKNNLSIKQKPIYLENTISRQKFINKTKYIDNFSFVITGNHETQDKIKRMFMWNVISGKIYECMFYHAVPVRRTNIKYTKKSLKENYNKKIYTKRPEYFGNVIEKLKEKFNNCEINFITFVLKGNNEIFFIYEHYKNIYILKTSYKIGNNRVLIDVNNVYIKKYDLSLKEIKGDLMEVFFHDDKLLLFFECDNKLKIYCIEYSKILKGLKFNIKYLCEYESLPDNIFKLKNEKFMFVYKSDTNKFYYEICSLKN